MPALNVIPLWISTMLLCILPAMALLFQPCPLLGPVFPVPTSLSTSPIMAAAFKNLTSILDSLVRTDDSSAHGSVAANETSFSIGFFSTDGEESTSGMFQYHHTTAALRNSTQGVHMVDENSIYRIGSISKVFTVYTLLLEIGDGYWNDLVTKHVPELARVAASEVGQNNTIRHVRWEDITLGELASHMAGIGREYLNGELLAVYASTDFVAAGLPPLSASDLPLCVQAHGCNRTEYLTGVAKRYPVHLSSTTPTYSNAAFAILAFALESITNKTFDAMLNDSILTRLQMNNTSIFVPTTWGGGVILPTDTNAILWSSTDGPEAPAGDMYSSLKDMISFGKSILSSTLLSVEQTRRWLKPRTHTSSLLMSVGAPWEIFRAQSINSRLVTDLYTKGGNYGPYGSLLVLSPDYDFGFVLLGAADKGVDPHVYADVIADTMLPALEKAARVQAQTAYAGSYRSSDIALNSSIVISANDDTFGMSIDSFISNGTDFLELLTQLLYGYYTPALAVATSVRLYPTNLHSPQSYGSSIAFRAVYSSEAPLDPGVFSPNCEVWVDVDAVTYGSLAWDEFVFNLDAEGNTESIEIPFIRTTLNKQKTTTNASTMIAATTNAAITNATTTIAATTNIAATTAAQGTPANSTAKPSASAASANRAIVDDPLVMAFGLIGLLLLMFFN